MAGLAMPRWRDDGAVNAEGAGRTGPLKLECAACGATKVSPETPMQTGRGWPKLKCVSCATMARVGNDRCRGCRQIMREMVKVKGHKIDQKPNIGKLTAVFKNVFVQVVRDVVRPEARARFGPGRGGAPLKECGVRTVLGGIMFVPES